MTEAVAAAAPAENVTAPADASEQANTSPEQAQESAQSPTEGGAAATQEKGVESARDFLKSLNKRESKAPAPEAAEETEAAEVQAEAPPVIVDEKGRKHDPATGKFLPEKGEEPKAADEAETTDAEAGTEPPDGHVRIALPEGHPLRDRGREFVDAPKADEDYHRWAINNAVRRAEVEQYQSRLAQMEEQLVRLQATQGATAEWQNTPEYREAFAQYQEIAAVDQKAAERFWKGVQGELQEVAEKKFGEAQTQRTQQQNVQRAQQFQAEAAQVIQGYMPPEVLQIPAIGQAYQQALYEYANEVEFRELRGEKVEYDPYAVARRFNVIAEQIPQVSQWIKGQREQQTAAEREKIAAEVKAKAEAEAKERERKQLEAATAKRRTNPHGALAMNMGTGRDALPSTDAPRNAKELRQSLRKVPLGR